jgi:hypothetical protein
MVRGGKSYDSTSHDRFLFVDLYNGLEFLSGSLWVEGSFFLLCASRLFESIFGPGVFDAFVAVRLSLRFFSSVVYSRPLGIY